MRRIRFDGVDAPLPECARELVRRSDVSVLVEMGVKSLGRDDRRMAEPLLDVLHRHPFVPEKARAAVAKVMEPDDFVRRKICFEEIVERRRDPARDDSMPIRPKVHVAVVRMVVFSFEVLLPLILLRLVVHHEVLNGLVHRERPKALLGFGSRFVRYFFITSPLLITYSVKGQWVMFSYFLMSDCSSLVKKV